MFDLCKQTRPYTGDPYIGYSYKNGAEPAQFATIAEAKIAATQLQEFNPVGWNIFDHNSRELVQGFDFFKE